MKKTLLVAAAASQIMTQAYAGGEIEPVEQHESVVHEHAESDYYVVVKGLGIIGDTVDHEGAVLDGDSGYGFGIDLGYRLGNGFAVEYDFAYAKNTVTEDGLDEGTAKYYTHALDLVYTHELTESVGIFGKVGVEYENEKIKEFDIDSDDTGFNFGAGVEMTIDHSYKFVVEYEHSTIDGPRGDSIFAGVMYNF
jgi:outer membrane protein X